MPVINGVYLKDFPALPGAVADANIIPIAISGNQIAYRTTVSGIVTDARVTSKLLTGLSVTGGAISATDTILQAFGKVQNQINGKQDTITLTTIGTSGAATFIANTLNIPNYADGGVLSLSAIGATPNANAATITGTVLNLQPASSSFGGVVTTGTQTIAGDKTLTGALVGTTGSFASSGGSDTFGINHSSGAGIALNITKGGNGEGIYVNKTSGSGNAATIIGTLNATTLVKSGGTSSQFLMADGSVNTSVLPSGAYLPLTGGTLTGALTGTSATFSAAITSTMGNNAVIFNAASATTGYQYMNMQNTSGRLYMGIEGSTAAQLTIGNTAYSTTFGSITATDLFLATNQTARLKIDGSTGAATFSSTVTASSLIKSGGTSSEFLKADGTVDSTAYGTGTVTSVAALTLGTSGTDLSSTVANGTTTPVITLNVPDASATARGVVTTGTQTISGNKTFSVDLKVNGLNIGKGGGSIATNTSIGVDALTSNTTGLANTAIGKSALNANTDGNFNTAVGSSSLQYNTTGISNSALGYVSLSANISGGQNSAFGNTSLTNNTTGVSNTAIGYAALTDNISGSNNVGIGYGSGGTLTTGSNNTFIGANVVSGSSSLANNILIGNGTGAVKAQHDGTNWTLTGGVTITGILTLNSTITNGTYTYTLPSATGTLALTSALSGYLPLTGGTLTGALSGTSATFSSTATATAFIPSGASVPTNGMYLSAANTLDFATNSTNQLSISSGGAATFSGDISARSGVIDSRVFKIYEASAARGGLYPYNLVLGSGTDYSLGIFSEGEIFMASGGSSTKKLVMTSGGEVYIAGTTDQGAYNLQCNGTGVWGAGAYVNGSDLRLKEDIKPILSGLDYVNKMNPVSFKYLESYSRDRSIQTGFIAQELKEVFKDEEWVEGIVQKGSNHYNVAYQNIIPILVKAIQELKAEIDILKNN
jgi:hypothetical protein